MPITFIKAHQPFQLLDCDPRDRGMDQAVCLEALRRSPTEFAGVLYVRPYGALADCSGFFRAIRTIRSDLLIVDDRCLCQPDSMGTSCDPSADVTLYSTGYGKLVDLGAGGFAHLAESVAYGIESLRFDATALETLTRRYKIAVARRQPFSGGLEDWLDTGKSDWSWQTYCARMEEERRRADVHRRRLNAIYTEQLPLAVQWPALFQQWRFQIDVPKPARLLRRLRAAGLFASRHYPPLGGGIFAHERFPQAEAFSRTLINLFNDRYYTEAQAVATARLVREHLTACGPDTHPAVGQETH